jgi:hypothetical protein
MTNALGSVVLLLHCMQYIDLRVRFWDLLDRYAEIIVPSPAGFGLPVRPAVFDSVHDLGHLHLDTFDAPRFEQVTIMNLSFGGWLLADIAVKCM